MKNIDGLRKNPHFKPRLKIASHIKLFKFGDSKQIATIAITFVLTFALSIATSQGLASIEAPAAATQPRAGNATPTYQSLAVTISGQPDQIPAFDPNVLSIPGEVYLPKEKLSLPDPLQKRKEFLEKYLRAKGSPLADHVDAISAQSQWKLIIGISRAESSFCKHQVTNNCWGIGGAWN